MNRIELYNLVWAKPLSAIEKEININAGFIIGMAGWIFILYEIFSGEAGREAARLWCLGCLFHSRALDGNASDEREGCLCCA